jgi:hypothetical protein
VKSLTQQIEETLHAGLEIRIFKSDPNLIRVRVSNYRREPSLHYEHTGTEEEIRRSNFTFDDFLGLALAHGRGQIVKMIKGDNK